MFEKLAAAELLAELLVRDEPVLAAVFLALPALSSRGGDGQRELGDLSEQRFFQGPLSGARGAGYDKDR